MRGLPRGTRATWTLLAASVAFVAAGACQPERFSLTESMDGEPIVLTADTPLRVLTLRACTDEVEPERVSITFSGAAVANAADDAELRVALANADGPPLDTQSVNAGYFSDTHLEISAGISDACGAGATLTVERLDPELEGEVTIAWSFEARATSFERKIRRDALSLFVDE